jgi:hypothetical protein
LIDDLIAEVGGLNLRERHYFGIHHTNVPNQNKGRTPVAFSLFTNLHT